jgi:ATP-dependent DNA helicase RecG
LECAVSVQLVDKRVYLFSDHLEIQNPGGLYGEATKRNFPEVNAYRNPVIADALKTLGFVNRFGRGVLRARQLLAENGNPPAEFHLESHSVTVDVKYT